jgi:hypothetical protein
MSVSSNDLKEHYGFYVSAYPKPLSGIGHSVLHSSKQMFFDGKNQRRFEIILSIYHLNFSETVMKSNHLRTEVMDQM